MACRTVLASTPGLHKHIVDKTKAKTDALTSQGYDLSPWYVPDGYQKHLASAAQS